MCLCLQLRTPKYSLWAPLSSGLCGSLFDTPAPPLLDPRSLNTLTHLWCLCVSRRACTSPPCLSLSGWNRSWGLVSDRLTGVHHSLAQKNQQHDGCAPSWHLQPEPQSWFISVPLSHLCFLCVRACLCGDWRAVLQGLACVFNPSLSMMTQSQPTCCRSTPALLSQYYFIPVQECCPPGHLRHKLFLGVTTTLPNKTITQFSWVQVWWQMGPGNTLEPDWN